MLRQWFWVLTALVSSGFGASSQASPFVEQHIISKGSYRGLAIGMSKMSAFLAARDLGSSLVTSAPCLEDLITFSNRQGLHSLIAKSEGIRYSTAEGSYTDVFLEAGRVVSKRTSPNVDMLPGIQLGDSAEALVVKLETVLQANKSHGVHSILRETDQIQLKDLDNANQQMIHAHACWRFEVSSDSPAGSLYKLDFDNQGVLAKIIHRRPRIRTE